MFIFLSILVLYFVLGMFHIFRYSYRGKKSPFSRVYRVSEFLAGVFVVQQREPFFRSWYTITKKSGDFQFFNSRETAEMFIKYQKNEKK